MGVNPIFRENNAGVVYGLTFIYNRMGSVFNGSDLGKGYSGQALIKQFNVPIAIGRDSGERERQERVERESDRPQLEGYNNSQPSWELDIPNEILDLMKAEQFYPQPTNNHLKRPKKKKRGSSR